LAADSAVRVKNGEGDAENQFRSYEPPKIGEGESENGFESWDQMKTEENQHKTGLTRR
jgi:hypothetical protein